jgi:putative Mg2+ transporter-C (MgtC) family protein
MFEFLNHWTPVWKNFGQIGIAYVLTLFIGWEQEQEEHTLGLRTFPLVGIASCGCLLIFGPGAHSDDQSRVLQGLITGIGFVGGGAILRARATVKGTATAASIWNAAVIGASVALEHYEIAVLLALLNLFTLRVFLPVKNWIDRRSRRSRVRLP